MLPPCGVAFFKICGVWCRVENEDTGGWKRAGFRCGRTYVGSECARGERGRKALLWCRLRDRHDDIRELVAKQLAVEQENAGPSLQLESRALTELVRYNWPGNIRQLFNVLARLACHAPSGTITAAQVRSELTRFRTIDPDTIILPEHCNTLLADESFDDFSTRVRGAVIEAVREIHGNMSRAAVRLKCDRSSLLRIAGRINSRNDKTGTTSVAA